MIEHRMLLHHHSKVDWYGSYAQGHADSNFDYGLAFEFSSEIEGAWLKFLTDYQTEPLTLWQVDLVALHATSAAPRARILSARIVVYG